MDSADSKIINRKNYYDSGGMIMLARDNNSKR